MYCAVLRDFFARWVTGSGEPRRGNL